jgi:prephenate dehydrogenase
MTATPTPAPAPPSAVWSAMWRTPRRRRSSADLVIFCVPPLAMGDAARECAPALAPMR